MVDSNYTHIEFVLDRSGSMSSIQSATQEGFDAFIAEQAAKPGLCTVTLHQFDNEFETVYRDRPIADVPPLQLVPQGSTALLDAIGRTINDLGARLAALPEHARPGTVIVGVMTDGYENASHEFTAPGLIKSMIERQESVYDWSFMYLGADQDAIEVGAEMGISRDHALTYGRGQARAAMSAAAAGVGRLREARMYGAPMAAARTAAGFTDDERAAAAPEADDASRT